MTDTMRHNPNKTISAHRNGITISYTDSCKHYNISYNDNPSILKDLQIHGNKFKDKSYQKIGGRENLSQQKVYRIALYGLAVFSPEEVKQMPFMQKNKIASNQKKVQRYLDNWKQEICHQKLGSFLTTIFRHSQFAMDLASYKDHIDHDNKNKMDFKDLGITRDMIVQKLVLAKLLPHNYYELV